MILYVEYRIYDHPITQYILSSKFYSQCVLIDHYKNIFDKQMWPYPVQKCLIVAKATGTLIYPTPPLYSPYPYNACLRTAINCIFDCSYCFLKGSFRNTMPVLFVNYEDVYHAIQQHVRSVEGEKVAKSGTYFTQKKSKQDYYDALGVQRCRFSSDYADILAFDHLSQFTKHFVPFFEGFPGHLLEIRTKSVNVRSLLSLFPVPPKNTEIAFSLNPQYVIEKYEKKTPSLKERVDVIERLLSLGWKVGIRVMPILDFPHARECYGEFAKRLHENLPWKKLHSFFIGGFVLCDDDYKVMKKRNLGDDLLARLSAADNSMRRISEEQRKEIYRIFYNLFGEKIFVCMDDVDF